MKITMFTAITAANSPPSGATAGKALRGDANANHEQLREADSATVLLWSTAGSGTMTAQLRVWGYSAESAKWHTVKDINAGVAIPEVIADSLNYSEVVSGLSAFERVYVELVAIAGTATAVSCQLVSRL